MNGTAWVDPPGIFYGVSYVMAALCYLFFIRRISLKNKNMLWCLFCGAALIAIMAVTDDVPQVIFLPLAVGEFVILYAMLYLSLERNGTEALYYTAHVFITGEFCASLEWLLCYFITRAKGIPHPSLLQVIWLLVIYAAVLAGVTVIGRRVYGVQADIAITGRETMIVLFMAVVIYAMSNLSYVPVNTPFSAQLPREIFNIHTWVDLGGLAILMAYHTQLAELQMKLDFDNMQNILDMQYANYQISKKTVDMVNQKYHDLKHQISLLREEVASGEALEYLDKMQSEIEAYEAQNKTGNKILDTILTGKTLYCQQNHIELTVVADGTLLDFMDIMDISSLFGNALDNAIESVGAIPDREKRLIHLTIARNKGFVRIRVENCYGGELNFQNGLPETTKKDRNYHGYGLKSIRTTVQKYNGSVTIEAKDGWFELRIMIPLI